MPAFHLVRKIYIPPPPRRVKRDQRSLPRQPMAASASMTYLSASLSSTSSEVNRA